MNGRFEPGRGPGSRPASGLVILAMLFVVACGGDGQESGGAIDRGPEAETLKSGRMDGSQNLTDEGPTAAESADDDLESALAAARGVEIPETEVRPEFERVETIHDLLRAPGFVETVEATAHQRSGATYALDMRIEHRADGPSYRMRATVEQTGGQTDQLRQMLEMSPYSRMSLGMTLRTGGEFEQIRIGERYWERVVGEEWLRATDLPELRAFGSEPPVATLSKTVDSPNVVKNLRDPIGEEEIEGLPTTHYRFEGILMFRPLWNGLSLPGAPWPPPETPAKEAGPGIVDVWLTDSGVVVRAELRLETEQGDLYEATLELTEFGEQPEIQPPS